MSNLKTFLAICVFVAIAGCDTEQSSNRQLNILFIVVDDLRLELRCYGASHIKSPHIDKLAAKSLVFERAYCQAPICSPSRMSFLSGLRPNETQINDNDTPIRVKLPDVITLPQYFKNNGYQTEAYGKVFHQGIGDSLSWDFYNDGPKHRSVYQLPKNTSINDVNDGKKRGRPYEDADVPDDMYTDGIIARSALEALDRFDKSRPFFLGVGFLKPHLPFLAPKKYWDLYERPREKYETVQTPPKDAPEYALNHAGEMRKYYGVLKEGPIPQSLGDTLMHGYFACVSYMDAQVGKILSKIEQLGISDHTIVVLFGDHGYKLGDFNDWCKGTHYELDTRIPLIIHHPKKNAGRTGSIVELIDLYPTLVAASSVTGPHQKLSGVNLMPLFDNPDQSIKSVAFSQRPRKKLEGYSIRTDKYRLVKWISKADPARIESIELYNYDESWIERENLANDTAYFETRQQLLRQMENELGK